jgi:hypothetical protein
VDRRGSIEGQQGVPSRDVARLAVGADYAHRAMLELYVSRLHAMDAASKLEGYPLLSPKEKRTGLPVASALDLACMKAAIAAACVT